MYFCFNFVYEVFRIHVTNSYYLYDTNWFSFKFLTNNLELNIFSKGIIILTFISVTAKLEKGHI